MDTKYIIYSIIALAIIFVSMISVYFSVQAFKKSKVNNEYTYGDNSPIEVTIYHVTWCPYSKKALEVWNSVKDSYNNKKCESGRKLMLIACNPEEDGSTCPNPIVNGEPIEGYPTIFCNFGGDKKHLEFKSKCTDRTLRKFLEDIKKNN